MDKKIELLVYNIKKHCKEYNIKFKLIKSEMIIADGLPCSGYFCDIDMELVVAIKKPKKDWMMVLLHEYSHMLQYINNKKIWLDVDNSGFRLWDWISNYDIKVGKNKVRNGINLMRNLELDCEKSVIRLINKYGLKDYISKDDYIRKSNSYVLFYNYVRKNRVWYKKAPYLIPEVYLNMSNKFDMNYSRLTKKQSELFKLCL